MKTLDKAPLSQWARAGLVMALLPIIALGVIRPVNAQNATEVVITGRKVATPGAETQTKTVSYADLDLSKSAGLGMLLKRIKAAATDVCSPQPQVSDIAGSADYKKCRSNAVSSAVTQVDNPGLAQLAANTGP
jgi:UrcA family protein